MTNRERHAMVPVQLPSGDALTMDSVPARVRKVCHMVAALLESYGCESERATDAAFAHVCWSARVAGVWPAIVADALKVQT